MSRVYSDTDDFSDGLNPDFHVVPNTSTYDPDEHDYETRQSHDLLLPDDEEEEDDSSVKPEDATTEEPLPPIEWHPAILMIARFIKKILEPIVKVVFAPRTQRAIIKSLVIIIVVAWVIMTSFTAYLTFYQRYIPKTAHIEPIYFQYTNVERPQGHIEFTGPNPTMLLRDKQAYDVSVQLHVPTSDINFDLGNFMVQVELQTQNGTVLRRSSRSAILRYQSYPQRILHVIAKAVPLLIGWTEESQHISVTLLEGLIEKKDTPITQARVTLSTSKLQVYDAQLSVVADFRGLRYYMYHRRIGTAFVFIVLFTIIEIIFAMVAWKMFGKNVWDKIHEAFSSDEFAVSERDENETNTAESNDQLEQEANRYQTEDDDDDDYLTED